MNPPSPAAALSTPVSDDDVQSLPDAHAPAATLERPPAPEGDVDAPLGERALSKLRWRCRRGLLENDLFIARFFSRHENSLTIGQAQGLDALMDLSDHDLLDLLLRRTELQDAAATPQARDVLEQLRT